MDIDSPSPSNRNSKNLAGVQESRALIKTDDDGIVFDPTNPSTVSITLAGCGGCGINLSRPMLSSPQVNSLWFDTSMANTRFSEKVTKLIDGHASGSGSNRAENAKEIERNITQLSDEEIGRNDVAIVQFALAGGTGSVIGPLLIREYARRGMRVIGVGVIDNSYSVAAKNTSNTLKTLSAICKNNDIYLPMILVSNDGSMSRRKVDEVAVSTVKSLIDLLTLPVYEVDRNDRLNWIDPTKVIGSKPGIKMMSIVSENVVTNPKIILGSESRDMVDSLLILMSNDDEGLGGEIPLPPSRLRKTGFYTKDFNPIVGKVSNDITPLEEILNSVEKIENQDRAQKHQTVSRLDIDSDDDIIL